MPNVTHFIVENLKDVVRFGPAFPMRYLRALSHTVYSVELPAVGRIYLRKHSSDISVLRQVFRDREYDLGEQEQSARLRCRYRLLIENGFIPLIIDAGANNGCSALWFASQFPEARIAAIEPDPKNFEICRMNVGQKDTISVFNAAIGGCSGDVVLHGRGNSPCAVYTSRQGTGAKMPVMTIGDILASFTPQHRILLVKIDIEGFESDLFSHNTGWLEDVMAVMIEPHDWMLPGQFSSVPFQRAMAGYRFEMLLQGENLIYMRSLEDLMIAPMRPSDSLLQDF
jgi:FkbM family methyltransferase